MQKQVAASAAECRECHFLHAKGILAARAFLGTSVGWRIYIDTSARCRAYRLMPLIDARRLTGSFGSDSWHECYWCGWWQQSNIYLIGWIGKKPLCDFCFDWHTEFDGGPYRPHALDRAAQSMSVIFHRLPRCVTITILQYLHAWHEP